MSQRAKEKELNLLKAGPWLALGIIVLLLFYLWPGGRPTAKTVKTAISSDSTATAPVATPAAPQGSQAQILDLLNFRSRPSLSDTAVIGTVSKGSTVKVVEHKDKWLKVELSDGRIGYIAFDPKYVRLLGSAP